MSVVSEGRELVWSWLERFLATLLASGLGICFEGGSGGNSSEEGLKGGGVLQEGECPLVVIASTTVISVEAFEAFSAAFFYVSSASFVTFSATFLVTISATCFDAFSAFWEVFSASSLRASSASLATSSAAVLLASALLSFRRSLEFFPWALAWRGWGGGGWRPWRPLKKCLKCVQYETRIKFLQCVQYKMLIEFLQCVQYETLIKFLQCVQYEMLIKFIQCVHCSVWNANKISTVCSNPSITAGCWIFIFLITLTKSEPTLLSKYTTWLALKDLIAFG